MEFINTISSVNKNYKQNPPIYKIIFNALFAVFGIVCAFIIIFNALFFQIRVVGASMQPTYNTLLSEDDNKFTSIYRDYVVVSRYISPQNGDVVILQVDEGNIIKRQIASSGDTLVLRQGDDGYFHYILNGTELDESYIKSASHMNVAYFEKFCKLENVTTSVAEGKIQATLQIPNGYIFALGDNRANSKDSSFYGPFLQSKIVGKVVMSYKYNETLITCLWRSFVNLF